MRTPAKSFGKALGVAMVVSALLAIGHAVAGNGRVQPKGLSAEDACQEKVCTYQATSSFESTTVSELVSSATPISDCPEAAEAYAEVGRDVAGFFGPCPTKSQIASVAALTPRERLVRKRALAVKRAMQHRQVIDTHARRATLYCPPDCTGTPANDDMNGDNTANDMSGAGGNDYIKTYAGPDIGRGEAGTDVVFVHEGNGEIARGGDDDGDLVVTWRDTGKDYAYGGQGINDSCYVDATDEVDSSCEWSNLPGA